MGPKNVTQWTSQIFVADNTLSTGIGAFLLDRKAQNLAPGTIRYYRFKLEGFKAFCELQSIARIDEITPDAIRQFLFWLEEQGHNPGGVHSFYRAVKAFLRWWEGEADPDGWKNPIRKVKTPRVGVDPILPVPLEDVRAMTERCANPRDKAILLFLLDTGARAAELCALNIADVDIVSGSVQIMQGKGRKPRIVHLGKKAKAALRAYVKQRRDSNPALWINKYGERLQYGGLRSVLSRRAEDAGLSRVPTPHDFRRAFAINFLRNGGDIYTLQILMGHSSLTVLRRYLAQTNQDIIEAHIKHSPVDRAL